MLGLVGSEASRNRSSPVPSGNVKASRAMVTVASMTSCTRVSISASLAGKPQLSVLTPTPATRAISVVLVSRPC